MEAEAPLREGVHDVRVPPASSSSLFLGLIGGFSLHGDGEPIHLPIGCQRLLAYLALAGRPMARSHVAGTFWPDVPDERAAANLRSVIWRVRRAGYALVRCDNGQVGLGPGVAVDVDHLETMARALLDGAGPPEAVGSEQLVAAGELLPDWSDEWVLIDRERFRQLRLHALERLCRRFATTGQFGRAVEACLAALAAEPLRESAQRQLIEVYLSEGNRAEALRQYASYEHVIRDEVGVEPAREIAELIRPLVAIGGPGH